MIGLIFRYNFQSMLKSISSVIVVLLSLLVNCNAQNQHNIDSLKKELINQRDQEIQFKILVKLTDLMKYNCPDEALNYIQRAYRISKGLDQKLEATIRMADMYYLNSEYNLSMGYVSKSIDYATELDNKGFLAEAYRILGRINMDIGKYEVSSENFYTCLRLFEELSNKKGISSAFSNIGNLYFVQKKYDRTLEYVLKSLDLSKSINDTIGISRNLNNVAACYACLGKFSEVGNYIREAIFINKRFGLKIWEGINYQNLGGIFKESKQYPDSAIYYFNKACQVFITMKSYSNLALIYLDLSDYYVSIGDTLHGIEFTKKSFDIADKYHFRKIKIEAAKFLHDVSLERNDIKNAYYYRSIQYELNDSLKLDESLVKLAQLELQYSFDKREQEKRIVQQKHNFIIVIVFVTLFLSILIILLLLAKQKMKAKNALLEQQRLQDEVDFKNKELTLNVMNLIKKNEILSEFGRKLLSIEQNSDNEETKEEIYQLGKDIEHTIDSKIWEEFEKRFIQVHGLYYSRLTEKFPDLTPNELKLCAFLKLNMSSKDISELTGQQVSAIEIARHRLRKKLGISNTQTNLITFLSQI